MMSYKRVQRFIPQSKYKLKATYSMKPRYITIHNTANDASASNEIAYMTRNNNATSYHVAIDDKEAIEAIPFNRNAWHCGDGQGDGNRKSIGIEICYSKSGGDRYKKAEENAVVYTAYLLKQYGWGIDRVKFHQDWSGKYCPHRILSEGRKRSFLDRIKRKLDSISNEGNADKPKEEDWTMQKLPNTQKKDVKAAFAKAYKDGVFSVDHSKNVNDMTIKDATLLMMSLQSRLYTK